jgi:hypothetical protein
MSNALLIVLFFLLLMLDCVLAYLVFTKKKPKKDTPKDKPSEEKPQEKKDPLLGFRHLFSQEKSGGTS